MSSCVVCREEGDLLIEWDDLVLQDTDDNESLGRSTPNDNLSVDNMMSGGDNEGTCIDTITCYMRVYKALASAFVQLSFLLSFIIQYNDYNNV